MGKIFDYIKDTLARFGIEQAFVWAVALIGGSLTSWFVSPDTRLGVVIVLFGSAIAILIILYLGALVKDGWGKQNPAPAPDSKQQPSKNAAKNVALRVFSHQAFKNNIVHLDGNKFISCTFENVIIVWNGGPFSFERCQIPADQVNGFQTGNSGIIDTVKLLGIMGALHPKMAEAMQPMLSPQRAEPAGDKNGEQKDEPQ